VKAVTELFEFVPQFYVVIDFAIENEDAIFILGPHGLVAALEVDDLQPDCAERDTCGFKKALLIRTAVVENAGCASKCRR
jgi:hypothetical protein